MSHEGEDMRDEGKAECVPCLTLLQSWSKDFGAIVVHFSSPELISIDG